MCGSRRKALGADSRHQGGLWGELSSCLDVAAQGEGAVKAFTWSCWCPGSPQELRAAFMAGRSLLVFLCCSFQALQESFDASRS